MVDAGLIKPEDHVEARLELFSNCAPIVVRAMMFSRGIERDQRHKMVRQNCEKTHNFT